jgi:hypothetical protein
MKAVLTLIFFVSVTVSAKPLPTPFPDWATRQWMELSTMKSFAAYFDREPETFYRIKELTFEKISDRDETSEGTRLTVVFDDVSCKGRWFQADYYAVLCKDRACAVFQSVTDCMRNFIKLPQANIAF